MSSCKHTQQRCSHSTPQTNTFISVHYVKYIKVFGTQSYLDTTYTNKIHVIQYVHDECEIDEMYAVLQLHIVTWYSYGADIHIASSLFQGTV